MGLTTPPILTSLAAAPPALTSPYPPPPPNPATHPPAAPGETRPGSGKPLNAANRGIIKACFDNDIYDILWHVLIV